MPDHLRAFIVILVLAPVTFMVARMATGGLIASQDFTRRRNVWFALTAIAFLSHNFWICMILAGAVLTLAGRRDANPIALYLFVLFAIPPLPEAVSGFGVVNYFFHLDYLRLLSLALLLPAAARLLGNPEVPRPGAFWADRLLIAYVAYQLVLVFFAGTFTNFLRTSFLHTIDIALPYFVASRVLRREEHFRDALASLVIGAGLLATIGIFESAKGWLLYAPLKQSLDVDYPIMNVLLRGDTQRAMASTGQPIAFGYVMVIAVGCWLYLQPIVATLRDRLLPLGLLLLALVATLSRGPWVGAASLALAFVLTGPRPIGRLLRFTAAGGVGAAILMLTPWGSGLIDLLPFVGDAEDGTITYRQQLLEVFVPIILDNPIAGASWYLYSAEVESLRQGEGIVDVVNTFIGVGLHSGVVGLLLFSGFFVTVAVGVGRSLLRVRGVDREKGRLGQTLLATLVGIVVTIFTVSSITVIPYLYWTVAGICVAYVSLESRRAEEVVARPSSRPARRSASATRIGARA